MNNQFYRAHIDITGKCNLRCVHCYAASEYTQELDFKVLENVFKQLQLLGIKRVAISGGEPLLREDFFKLIALCPDDISILTNAHLVDDKFIHTLRKFEKRDKKIFTLRISLDGIESYEKVRKMKPDTVLENIKNLLDNELIVVVNTTIMPFHTKKEILGMYTVLKDLGVDQWSIDIPFYQGSAKKNDINTDAKKYADIIIEIARRYKKQQPEMIFDSVSLFTSYQLDSDYSPHFFEMNENPCSYQFKTITIDARGNLKVCPSMEYTLGSIFDYQNIEEYRNGDSWKKFKSIKLADFTECKKCKYRSICGGGCRANVNQKNIMETDTLSCYLMERFENDVIPLLPKRLANIYIKRIQDMS
jgi:radical SAM protein with 4Fe4S-binding SPASM domain